MDHRAEKQLLLHHLILNGAQRDEFKDVAREARIAAPPELLSRWEKQFFAVPTMEYPIQPRLINRFRVGADPEFAFVKRKNPYGETIDHYVYAEKLGFTQLDAFGCDMSGRQAELRAYPSRFVLDVVTSLMDTLRWMNEVHGMDKHDWVAPPIFQNDGIGGHVHIGRKRPKSAQVIGSLDGLTRVLLNCQVFDKAGQEIRVAVTHYGKYGDFRPQSHGFEYRTMPSWMSTPWTAYLTLTLAKLAVMEDFRPIQTPKGKPERIVYNLLRAYQNRDDDARIALIALELNGLPGFSNADFKWAWGIPKSTQTFNPDDTYIPPVIEPEAESKRELFLYLTKHMALPQRLPKPVWTPFNLSPNVYKVTAQSHIAGSGCPDVAMGLLSKDVPVSITRSENDQLYFLGPNLNAKGIRDVIQASPALKGIPVSVTNAPGKLVVEAPRSIYDMDAHSSNKNMVKAIRKLLTNTELFPIAKFTEVSKLDEYKVVNKKDPALLGRVLSRTEGKEGAQPDGI